MTLSGYIPDLIGEDIEALVERAVAQQGMKREDIHQWCVHPGGKKILEAIEKSLSISKEDLSHSYRVLRDYGNMSSATILFVLKELFQPLHQQEHQNIFAMAFGPGLTLETFIACCAEARANLQICKCADVQMECGNGPYRIELNNIFAHLHISIFAHYPRHA